MRKYSETLEEAVRKYVEYEPSNPCWQDFWYFESMCNKYGYEAVHKEVRRQEQNLS